MPVIVGASFLINMISEFFIWFSDIKIFKEKNKKYLTEKFGNAIMMPRNTNVCKDEVIELKGSTLKQIAKELGLSISTVSRAVNGKNVVKEETRCKVMELVEKYAYSPNEVARALQKSSTQMIAVVLPDVSEAFFGTIVNEMDRVVSQKKYMLILADTHEKVDKEIQLLQMLHARRIEALVLASVDVTGDSVSCFSGSNTPVVFIDNVPHLENIDAITIDNQKASCMAIEYLLERGHRQIATIIGSREETTGLERMIGYRTALKKNGITVNEKLIEYGDYKRESGYLAMKRLLAIRQAEPFSAVYVTSEKMTYGAIQAIRESGLNVPEDISVMGFDIHTSEDGWRQRITSIRQPESLIGRLVGERLLVRLGCTDDVTRERISLDPLLEEGDTVRKI